MYNVLDVDCRMLAPLMALRIAFAQQQRYAIVTRRMGRSDEVRRPNDRGMLPWFDTAM
jgi:hypothetical protein